MKLNIQKNLFLTYLLLVFVFILPTQISRAQEQTPPAGSETAETGYQGINLQAPLGGLTRVTNLGDYIAGLYRYSISIAAILAGIMITVGGVKWLTAAGNAALIESAKKTISGALIGLILVMSSYVILNTINPQLVKLKVPTIRSVPRSALNIRETIVDAGGYRDRTACDNDPLNVCPGGGCVWDSQGQRCTTIAGGGRQGELGGVCGPAASPSQPEPTETNPRVGCTGNQEYCVRATAGGGGINWICTRGHNGDPCGRDEDCKPIAPECVQGRCQGSSGRVIGQECERHDQCGSAFCAPELNKCFYGDQRQECIGARGADSRFCRQGFVCANCGGRFRCTTRGAECADLVSRPEHPSCTASDDCATENYCFTPDLVEYYETLPTSGGAPVVPGHCYGKRSSGTGCVWDGECESGACVRGQDGYYKCR
ncbi:hypothetical protein HYT45_03920 [Candidatus Uhrbacteria bacterium]|nr:hypothetical protein [Candidatus Uhrbacteria bacterium]